MPGMRLVIRSRNADTCSPGAAVTAIARCPGSISRRDVIQLMQVKASLGALSDVLLAAYVTAVDATEMIWISLTQSGKCRLQRAQP